MIEHDELLEPYKLYKTTLKLDHNDNITDYFNGMTDEAGIDVDANALTVRQIKEKNAQINKITKKRDGLNFWKGFLLGLSIFMIVAGALTLAGSILAKAPMPTLVFLIIGSVLVIGLAIFILVMRKKSLQKKIDKLNKQIADLTSARNSLIEDATNQMMPLNNMFDWNMPAMLFSKTIPLIQMDQYFDKEKFQYMHEKYGFEENTEPNISSVFIQSGSILGNPFILERNYVQEMTQHTYTGSITIHWTTITGTGKDRHIVNHSQTLTASVTKPMPVYYLDTWLVYSNEAGSRLQFSRKPSKANSMNDKQLDKFVKQWDKEWDKKVEKLRREGKNPPAKMSNEEFEALFGATDRTNDVEFRLLFTPLAQKSMLELIKSKTPYGDDFEFVKRGPLNFIKTNHSQTFDFDGDPKKFISYDYQQCKTSFINYCNEYLQSFYFDLAPLMCIPLYQQHETDEYIFNGKFATNVSSFETEIMANKFGDEYFRHPDTDTPCILKRTSAYKNGTADKTIITAHSFQKIRHVEYITKRGGDGLNHDVPVEWFEYIPLEQTTEFEVQNCHVSRDQFNTRLHDGTLESVLDKYGRDKLVLFRRGLISFLANANGNAYNGKELDDIFAIKED